MTCADLTHGTDRTSQEGRASPTRSQRAIGSYFLGAPRISLLDINIGLLIVVVHMQSSFGKRYYQRAIKGPL